MREWNAETYHRVSNPQFDWGTAVLARLPLDGDECVLDVGCGTGRLTAQLLRTMLASVRRLWPDPACAAPVISAFLPAMTRPPASTTPKNWTPGASVRSPSTTSTPWPAVAFIRLDVLAGLVSVRTDRLEASGSRQPLLPYQGERRICRADLRPVARTV